MAFLDPRDDGVPEDENVGPILMWISGTLMFFIILTTALRLYVRTKNHILGWDDATIALSVACALTRLAFETLQHQHGNGRHKIYLSDYDYMMINMYGWYSQIFLFSSVALLKISIGLLILRIKDTTALRILLWTVMTGVCITNFGVVIILLAECRPAGFWRGASAVCWPNSVRIYSIYATIGFSVLTDLILSLLPLVVVWKVRIPLATKVSVCALMSLGLCATGFGIARAASLGIKTTDLSWMYCIAAIWSNLELFLGIIAANLALSRSVWVFFRGDRTSASPGASSYLSTHPSRSGFTGKLRGDRYTTTSTIVESRRRPSIAHSGTSDIPLEPGIKKKTEFWLSETDEDMEKQRRNNLDRA